MNAPAPAVTPELRQVLRRLKLGKMLDTLPERLALAKHNKLGHAAFLELVWPTGSIGVTAPAPPNAPAPPVWTVP